MVVTRRAPAPVPTSRTNSAQPIPRVKGKAPQDAPEVSSPLASDANHANLSTSVDESRVKGKGKWKNKYKKEKQKRRRGGSTFAELLSRAFLLWFTIYTLTVCPNDEALKSPICRGLHSYRRYVLEPYLLPQLHRALEHPSIAPYVDRATPVIQRSIDTAKPIVIQAHAEWNQRVVPQWKKRVVPQWKKYVDPQLNKYVWPHFARAADQITPYITTALNEYESRLAPQVRLASQKLQTWQHEARPYVILAAHKTYDGYQIAKPYAIPILERIQALLLQLVQLLGEQRRQLVDPHIQKIWEKVKELSSGDTKPVSVASKSFAVSASKASATVSSFVSSLLETSTPLVPAASEAVVGPASSVLPETISEVESIPSPFPSTNPTVTLKDSETRTTRIQSASSVATSASADAVTGVLTTASSATEQLESLASSLSSVGSSVVLEEVIPTISSFIGQSIATPISSISQEAQASAADAASKLGSLADQVTTTIESIASSVVPTILPEQDETQDDFSLDDIYAELGLADIETNDPQSDNEPLEIQEEDEETKAERLRVEKENTARKRADITARHTKWEAQMEDKMASARKELRKNLVASRKAAAAELKQSRQIREELDNLVEDAEKYLKGAEKYLTTMRKDTRSGRTNEEKETMWARVIDKVDKKFEQRLDQTDAVVNGWYMDVVNAELAEVHKLAGEVKEIADAAQGDIGLDYAWLDDVTYHDWQRYHDLERRTENFTALALAIQNGTHPSPPINPVLDGIQDLQTEVQDIVIGFETRLRRIKRSGDRAFGAETPDSDGDSVPSDATVSTLPIEGDAHNGKEEDESPAIPPVTIGRSKEEILSVLDRIAQHEGQATSAPDDKNADPEHVVDDLAQEVIDEGNLASSPASKRDEL
ncbi:hypothetical protein BDW22DRAFT_1361464 [Trametopsis cervina]|nr:hypothetical protein BDW22DRAFT_1361464 [Trametopsis cervina]